MRAFRGCELLERDGLLDLVVLAAEELTDDVRVAVRGHAQVGRGEGVVVGRAVLQVDLAPGGVDAVVAGGVEAAAAVEVQPVAQGARNSGTVYL